MLDAGAVSPAELSVNVTSDQELADINAWLERLSQNIPPNMDQDTMMMDSSPPAQHQQTTTDIYNSLGCYDNTTTQHMLSSYENHSTPDMTHGFGGGLYPSSQDQDMYVRSHPIMPNESATTGLYSDLMTGNNNNPSDMLMGMASGGYNPNDMLISQRSHIMNIPDITSTQFDHNIQTSLNLNNHNPASSSSPTSSKASLRTHKVPTEGQVDKVAAEKSFMATKSTRGVSTEEKKKLATMAVVFNAKDSMASSPSKSSPVTPIKQDEKPTKEQPQQKKKISSKNQDAMDLLTCDMSDMSLKKKQQNQTSSTQQQQQQLHLLQHKEDNDENASLYPDLNKPVIEKNNKKNNKMSEAQRHRLLLQLIRQQINKSYEAASTNVCNNAPSGTTTSGVVPVK